MLRLYWQIHMMAYTKLHRMWKVHPESFVQMEVKPKITPLKVLLLSAAMILNFAVFYYDRLNYSHTILPTIIFVVLSLIIKSRSIPYMFLLLACVVNINYLVW